MAISWSISTMRGCMLTPDSPYLLCSPAWRSSSLPSSCLPPIHAWLGVLTHDGTYLQSCCGAIDPALFPLISVVIPETAPVAISLPISSLSEPLCGAQTLSTRWWERQGFPSIIEAQVNTSSIEKFNTCQTQYLQVLKSSICPTQYFKYWKSSILESNTCCKYWSNTL